jgi:aspartate/methionine/tyrosine aminotransferase
MRQAIQQLQASKIRELANAGLGRSDVLAFWFGESDEVTPVFIRQAAIDSLQAGETFYAHNLGLPELRESISAEMVKRHRLGIGSHRIAVTSGGVNALMLAMQALVDAGDEVLVITPVWPNLTAQPQILGAQLRTLSLEPTKGRWELPLEKLLNSITADTRLLVLNSPNNPTGWTLNRQEQQAILEKCRSTGTWILADEVYESLYFLDSQNHCAPSFLDIAQTDDRLVVAHSFSKSFLMTGWRLGWLVMPPEMTEHMGKLIEFNTSCASVFVQRAGLVALKRAEEVTPRVVSHLRLCRDTLADALKGVDQLEFTLPDGGMYLFLRLPEGMDDFQIAKRLVQEAGLGLAPGSAFASEAQGWLRWCFASKELDRLRLGAERLDSWLSKL